MNIIYEKLLSCYYISLSMYLPTETFKFSSNNSNYNDPRAQLIA